MTNAPERIHLDGDSEAGEGMFPRCFENPKYCSEPAIEYIRADLVAAMEAENQRLRHALRMIDLAAHTVKSDWKDGAPVSAFNLASGILLLIEGVLTPGDKP